MMTKFPQHIGLALVVIFGCSFAIYFFISRLFTPLKDIESSDVEKSNVEVVRNERRVPNDNSTQISEHSMDSDLAVMAEEILNLPGGRGRNSTWRNLIARWKITSGERSLLDYLVSSCDHPLASGIIGDVLRDWTRKDPAAALDYARRAIESDPEKYEYYLTPFLTAMYEQEGFNYVLNFVTGLGPNDRLYRRFRPVLMDHLEDNLDQSIEIIESLPFEASIKSRLARSTGSKKASLRGWEWFDELVANGTSADKYFSELLSGTLSRLYSDDKEGVTELFNTLPIDPAFDFLRIIIAADNMPFNPWISVESAMLLSDQAEKQKWLKWALPKWFGQDFDKASEWSLVHLSDDPQLIEAALKRSEVPTSESYEKKMNKALLIEDVKRRERTIYGHYLNWAPNYPIEASQWFDEHKDSFTIIGDFFQDRSKDDL